MQGNWSTHTAWVHLVNRDRITNTFQSGKGALLLISLSLLPPHGNLHIFWPSYRILLLLQFPDICLQFVSSFVSKRGHCKINYNELFWRYWSTRFTVNNIGLCVFSLSSKQYSKSNVKVRKITFSKTSSTLTTNPCQTYLWGTEQPHKGSKVEILSWSR